MRILVVGWELPDESIGRRIEAGNYRTWQLVEPLLRNGHDVCLLAGRLSGNFETLPPARSRGRLQYEPTRFNKPGWVASMQRAHDVFRPDGVVGVTFLGALRASRLRTSAPMWFDLYGDPMAEMQARAYRVGSDRGIVTQLGFLRTVLKKGDVYSACSGAQRLALVGQLAAVGRLNGSTFGYEFVHVVPPAIDDVPVGSSEPAFRGMLVPSDSPVVLWCGGFNTWTDVDTLSRGLTLAMDQDSRLHFVSVGGALEGSDVYARFVQLVDGSAFRDRFHLMGWQPVERVASFYSEADVAITLDAACYEAELGTRTRLVEMLRHGLPVLTTDACELSHVIDREALGLVFPVGDSTALARQLLALIGDDAQRRHMSERASAYAMTSLSVASAAAPLLAWAARPHHAGDRTSRRTRRVNEFEFAGRALARRALWAFAGLDQ
jgi:glycosyltransferase involved in cell wall biosynthesis